MAKILIIDDDLSLIRMYKDIFTERGHQVEGALSGEEGLEKAKKEKPDLILLDIIMPKMNGLDVLTQLKEDPKTKKIPVVLLTIVAKGDERTNRGLQLGAAAYLEKSVVLPQDVVTKVEEILSTKR